MNTLIDSNDLVRNGIPANGDCFFNAVSVQLDSHLTGTELRQKTVEHLVFNQEHYIGYLTHQDKDEEEKTQQYHLKVSELKKGGKMELRYC